MKGVIFNIVEEAVTEHFGPDTWDSLLLAAGSEGAYTSLGSYPDADLSALITAASDLLSLPPHDVLRFLGRACLPRLVQRYPQFPQHLYSSRDLLSQLDEVIHPRVLALYPGSVVPSFHQLEQDATTVVLRYRSTRGLCHLAEGLILGAGDYFNEHVGVHQRSCVYEGGSDCELVVSYGPPPS